MMLAGSFYFLLLLLLLVGQGDGQRACPSRDLSLIEEGRRCRKACQVDSDCNGAQKRCLCDDACGFSCFNSDASCDHPEEIPNGEIVGTDFSYGSTVLYRCTGSNYALNGTARRQCRSDRKWSGTVPNCYIACGQPSRLSVGFAISNKDFYLPGEQLTHECFGGYRLQGDPIITCQNNGDWSERRFMCEILSCSIPPLIRNGIRLNDDVTFGSRVTYRCNKGYVFSGRQNFVSCIVRESRVQWFPSEPDSCDPVTCSRPVAPENGRVNDVGIEFTYGNEVTYECNQGFRLDRMITGRCNENSTWGEVPSCILDMDCDFENFRRPFCSYVTTGSGWEREFSTNYLGMRGYVARVSSSSRQNNNEAKLTSPAVTREVSKCLKFYYMIDTLSVSTDFSLSLLDNNGQRERVWTPHQSDSRNEWLSSVVFLGESSTDVQLEFVARNLETTLSVDIDDVVVSEQCENFCSSSPCQGRGTCYNRIDGYQCFCSFGFSGADCSERPTSCAVPSHPTNGRVTGESGNNVRIGETLTLRCDTHYFFPHIGSQMQSLRCETGGVWSETPQTACVVTYRCTTDNNQPCALPFQYKNELYYSCTDRDNFFRDWCSRTSNWDRDELSGRCGDCPDRWNRWSSWEACSSSCGIGKRVRRRSCNGHEPGSAFCVGRTIETTSCQGAEVCLTSEIQIGNSFYGIFQTPTSRSAAATHCNNEYGGDLASIPNATYNDELQREIATLPLPNEFYAYYIGLSDLSREGRWVWPGESTASQYTNWDQASGEPNGRRGENCATIRFSGKWNDRACIVVPSRPLYFICEKSNWGAWGSWGSCSNGCGRGTQIKRRSCLHALGISQYCEGAATQSRSCTGTSTCGNQPAAAARPTDRWEDWSLWGTCSTTCGSGEQTRSRTCNGALPGSVNCIGSATATRQCSNSNPCSGPEITVGRKVYRVVLEKDSHNRARQFCQGLGSNGDLAVLKSSPVRTPILEALQGLSTLPQFQQFHFGLYIDGGNTWRWVDNAMLQTSERNWAAGEPNNENNNEACASMHRTNGRWNDIPCSTSLPYVCERERDANPCASMPCMNGGSCENDGATRYHCFCHPLVGGDDCEVVLDQCFSSPCQNDGTCVGNRHDYTCTCGSEWTGRNCDQRL